MQCYISRINQFYNICIECQLTFTVLELSQGINLIKSLLLQSKGNNSNAHYGIAARYANIIHFVILSVL